VIKGAPQGSINFCKAQILSLQLAPQDEGKLTYNVMLYDNLDLTHILECESTKKYAYCEKAV
jgi:hypothetical protein